MAVLGAGGAALYTLLHSADPEPTDLTVRYRTDVPATATVAKPWLEVINTSKKDVALSDVTLRYYFTVEDSSEYGSNCVQTHVGCSNITVKIGTVAGPTQADSRYVQIGFTPGAGSLAPGETSQGIGLQLYRLDHKKLDQANDRSYNAEKTHYAPSKLVTAYLRGGLVWGEEQSGGAPAPGKDSPTPVSAAAAPPAGVMFDNFHYSGPDDPALASNGWQARTGEGGPGIRDTWSAAGISFPSEPTAQGGQALQLRVNTDGTRKATRQAELHTTRPDFFTGTVAARVHFSDKPTSGRDGDHINESFFAISPVDTSPNYSELDYEYMPNGGWGSPGPQLDTTSWRNSQKGDRVTRGLKKSLKGWHTVMITAQNGKVTYSLDGRKVFSNDSRYFPRERMGIHFSAWLIDLPFAGPRTWDMKVNWTYYQAGRAVSPADVQKAVDGFYSTGTNYINTLPKS
ncbi:hydrolase [Streptomyces sp. NBC_01142]|uniref:cellulose binding domain-containing protein n=1 Tax=Streptomyces sp. NBC_01142 TaxID=2975865 RepID=UPI002251C1D0|nr:cellulose binding domain-containing protein [Streptomyces sp. NBC_01142]MCX4822887.1 hydrolase [Streptomyces sp. NBC_01142]